MRSIKTKLVIIAVFSIICCFVTVNAHADGRWYVCSVDKIGLSSKNAMIMLTDKGGSPEFTKKWFAFDYRVKQMLALAITSKVNNINLSIFADVAMDDFPVLLSIYLGE